MFGGISVLNHSEICTHKRTILEFILSYGFSAYKPTHDLIITFIPQPHSTDQSHFRPPKRKTVKNIQSCERAPREEILQLLESGLYFIYMS